MHTHFFKDTRHPKALAKDLHRALLAAGLQSSLARAQETVAGALGHASWHAMAAGCRPASASPETPGFREALRDSVLGAVAAEHGAGDAGRVVSAMAAVADGTPPPDLSFFDRVERTERLLRAAGDAPARRAWASEDRRGSIVAGLRIDPDLADAAFAAAVAGFVGRSVPAGRPLSGEHFADHHGYVVAYVEGDALHLVGASRNGGSCERRIAIGADGRLGASRRHVGKAVFRDLDNPARGTVAPMSTAEFYRMVEEMALEVWKGVAASRDPDEIVHLQGHMLEDGSAREVSGMRFDLEKGDEGNAAWMRTLVERNGPQASCVFFGAGALDGAGRPDPARRLVVIAGCGIDGSHVHRVLPVSADGRVGTGSDVARELSPYCSLYPDVPRFAVSADGRLHV